MAAFSAASSAISRSRSAAGSHAAFAGLSAIAHNHTPPHNRPGAASSRNIVRQSETESTKPEIGLAIIGAIARLSRNTVLARARSGLVNQARISTMVQVSTPPSARPRANRLIHSSVPVWTKAVVMEIAAHASNCRKMMRLADHTPARRPAGICRTM